MKIDAGKLFGSHLFIAALLIALLILVGTAGFMILEKADPMEAFYHSVVSITTTGYSDIATKDETRIFTIFLLLFSVTSFYYLAGAIAETLIAGRVFEVLKLRRVEGGLEKAKDHVILCGYGDVGSLIAEKVEKLVVVEKDEAAFSSLLAKGSLCVRGDSTNPETLKAAGVARAKAMIIALDSDPEVVYTILTAKELNPGLRVYARANERTSVSKMKKAGAAYVICLPEVGSRDLINALEGRQECLGTGPSG